MKPSEGRLFTAVIRYMQILRKKIKAHTQLCLGMSFSLLFSPLRELCVSVKSRMIAAPLQLPKS
jgi:hypothetical protein